MRLIDADKLHYSRIRIAHSDGIVGGYNAVVMSAEIKDAPTVDAVPVVRCAMCRFYEDAEYDGCTKSVCRLFGRQMQDGDYCSYGECKGG